MEFDVPLPRLKSAVKSAIQAERLRRPARASKALLLSARGPLMDRLSDANTLRNIYAATLQKSGSQWIKALFTHDLIRSQTRMATFPQFRYDEHQYRRRFPARCFVPGLYLSYPAYAAIEKPPPYRTIYVARDPRDIVVSWYFSVRDTHRVMGNIPDIRKILRSLGVHDGLLFSINWLTQPLLGMGTWTKVEEQEVAFFRLEELALRPETEVLRLLAHCNILLTKLDFQRLLRETSRQRLQERDLAQRQGHTSHYRLRQSGHREHFAPAHYAAFRTATNDLVERLGYSWE